MRPDKTLLSIAITLFLFIAFVAATDKLFGACSFGYGVSYSTELLTTISPRPTELSHVTFWLESFSMGAWTEYSWETRWLQLCTEISAIPVAYGYLIAGKGKSLQMSDCDMGSNNLCKGGADMLRDANNWTSILDRYTWFCDQMLRFYPSTKPIIFLIEPDFTQYTATGSSLASVQQDHGGIPDDQMVTKWREIKSRIKAKYPNAKIGVDISPWWNDNLKTFYQRYNSDDFDLSFVSGGRSNPSAEKIRTDNNNNVTWKNVNEWNGNKPILADNGYGVGGGVGGDDSFVGEWFNIDNITTRFGDGVRGVSMSRNNGQMQHYLTNQVRPNFNAACNISGGNIDPSQPLVEDEVSIELKGQLLINKTFELLATALTAVFGEKNQQDSIDIIKTSSSSIVVNNKKNHGVGSLLQVLTSMTSTATDTSNASVASIATRCINSNAKLTQDGDKAFVFTATIDKTDECTDISNWKKDPTLSSLAQLDTIKINSAFSLDSMIGIMISAIAIIGLMF